MEAGARRRVLVVDDNALNVFLVRTLLAADHELADAASLAQARTAVRDFTPDLILLDIKLPDGDGLAYARELASTPKRPRVVILSAHAGAAIEAAAREAGADGFITKPIEPVAFQAAVAHYLSDGSDPPYFTHNGPPTPP